MTPTQKIADAFSDYEILKQFNNHKSVFLVTSDQIIIVNNKYNEKTWGELNGQYKHVYLEIHNIMDIFTKDIVNIFTDYEVVIMFNQYCLIFPLETRRECVKFIDLVKRLKKSINEN